MTFGEYAKTWEETILPLSKPATQVTVRSHLRKLVAVFDHLPIDAPSADFQRFFTQLSQVMAPKSVRNIYSSFHLVMTAALRDSLLLKLPAVVLPRSARPEQDWLTLQEMRSLVSPPSKLRPLLALLAETGLRIGEALALQVQDINWEKLTVARSIYNGRVQNPKTAAAKRTLTISTPLWETLSKLLTSDPNSFLFRSSIGKPLWPDKVGKEMHQLMEDLKIKPMGAHGFRRGNATLCVQLEVPDKVIAYRLGHEAQGLTLGRYAQTFIGIDSKYAERIGKELFGK
jgi:integrase